MKLLSYPECYQYDWFSVKISQSEHQRNTMMQQGTSSDEYQGTSQFEQQYHTLQETQMLEWSTSTCAPEDQLHTQRQHDDFMTGNNKNTEIFSTKQKPTNERHLTYQMNPIISKTENNYVHHIMLKLTKNLVLYGVQ